MGTSRFFGAAFFSSAGGPASCAAGADCGAMPIFSSMRFRIATHLVKLVGRWLLLLPSEPAASPPGPHLVPGARSQYPAAASLHEHTPVGGGSGAPGVLPDSPLVPDSPPLSPLGQPAPSGIVHSLSAAALQVQSSPAAAASPPAPAPFAPAPCGAGGGVGCGGGALNTQRPLMQMRSNLQSVSLPQPGARRVALLSGFLAFLALRSFFASAFFSHFFSCSGVCAHHPFAWSSHVHFASASFFFPAFSALEHFFVHGAGAFAGFASGSGQSPVSRAANTPFLMPGGHFDS